MQINRNLFSEIILFHFHFYFSFCKTHTSGFHSFAEAEIKFGECAYCEVLSSGDEPVTAACAV